LTQSAATNSVDPGFPREELSALVRRLPRYGRLAWALARDPRLSRLRRAAVMAGAAYVISPIDLVPGIIPVAGQLDDLLIALGVIRVALDGLKPEVRAERLAAAGLSQADLDADVRFTGAIAAWMGRSAAGAGRRAVSGVVATGARAGDRLLQAGRGIRHRVGRPGGNVSEAPTTETAGDR
jgi:uncharacterized membrane protein YkvA (DUF1232 family)